MGIERLNVIENFTGATHFELEYMPFTHSLLGALVWAGAIYGLFRLIPPRKHSVALVLALGVFSHWVLDLIVHTPDLPLWSDSSPKVGFGIWNSAVATYALEAAFLLGGLWFYLRATKSTTTLGKYGMIGFVALLLVVNIVNVFGPLTSDSKVAMAGSALGAYFAFAAIAFWLDKKRVPAA